ncbi:unnamed protein product [Effrenium voratum]|uniref:Secreted RxLR effector peptide protein n=1 Tax=Effrenium voratum TaxID=2562239 RepID=A0AA36IFH2_9DINO|nr:unnamed protein product [Effrenium voratum]CAJ1386362.1 unnamed protein product [Effrenium voratum]
MARLVLLLLALVVSVHARRDVDSEATSLIQDSAARAPRSARHEASKTVEAKTEVSATSASNSSSWAAVMSLFQVKQQPQNQKELANFIAKNLVSF